MRVVFRRSFLKDIRRLDPTLSRRVEDVINQVEKANNLHEINNLKRLSSAGPYYRIRIGDYRIGLKLENDTVVFVRFLHRRNIYRYFP